MIEHKFILLCGEVVSGGVTAVTKELLNAGSSLGKSLNAEVGVLLIGKDVEEPAKELIALGATKVYIVSDLASAEGHPELYFEIAAKACDKLAPSIVIFGHTDIGRDVAPRLAARLGSTVVMDCTAIAVDPDTKRLMQTKPVYGGNAIAVWVSETETPQVVTLRPRSVMPAEADSSRKGEVVKLDIAIEPALLKSTLLETVTEEAKGIKLEEAKIIVSGGGGIGGKDGFKLLEELAQVLGGVIGVTRVPCDEGWLPLSFEIGQTGHIVVPSLYVAVGISGAPQHMAGCSASKYIVAINRDPEAHIFKESDFGIIGDYREILPPLTARCKELH